MLQNLLSKIHLTTIKKSLGFKNYNTLTKYVTSKPLNNTVIIKRFMAFRQKVTPEIFRIKDSIPKDYQLVYRCTMSSYLYTAQYISVLGLAGAIVIFTTTYSSKMEYQFDKKTVDYFELTNEEYQSVIFMVSFVFLTLAACVLINKFPIRIYFNDATNTYLGFTYGKLPNTKTILNFKAGELVEQPNRFKFLPWDQHKFKTKDGKVIILLEQYFRRPQDLNIMLGHVKM